MPQYYVSYKKGFFPVGFFTEFLNKKKAISHAKHLSENFGCFDVKVFKHEFKKDGEVVFSI